MDTKVISRIVLGFGIAALVSSAITIVVVPAGASIALWTLIGGLVLIAAFVLTNRTGVARTFSGKATTFYAVTVVAGALLIGALAAGNYVAVQKKATWDVTANKLYTLAEDTTKTVTGLKDEVKITAFYGAQDQAYPSAKNLFDRYQSMSDKVKVEFVDPYANPQLVKDKDIRENGARIIVSAGRNEARVNGPTEEGLTNGILKVLRSREKIVYFTKGHGEANPEDESTETGYGAMSKKMQDEGLRVKTLQLATEAIPEDAAAVVVLGPRSAFFQPEVDALRAFVDRGGSMMVALEPGVQDPVLQKLMEDYGYVYDNALIVDPVSRILGGGAAIPVVQKYVQHAITEDFDLATLFPTARPVVSRGDANPRPTVIATSNPSAWGETNLTNPQASYDEGEKRGELGIVAVSERTQKDAKEDAKASRIIAAGDSEFANNKFMKMGGNSDLFLNMMNWMTSQDDRITIRPKQREASRLLLTENQTRFLNIFSLNALPMLVLAAGLSVWLVRRAK
jgi:ABC-type uncharacterized transport system involved in gliding motility auxiliary subunit